MTRHEDKRKIAVRDMVNRLLLDGAIKVPEASHEDLVVGALSLLDIMNDGHWLALGRRSGNGCSHYQARDAFVAHETRADVEKLLRSMLPADDDEVFPNC